MTSKLFGNLFYFVMVILIIVTLIRPSKNSKLEPFLPFEDGIPTFTEKDRPYLGKYGLLIKYIDCPDDSNYLYQVDMFSRTLVSRKFANNFYTFFTLDDAMDDSGVSEMIQNGMVSFEVEPYFNKYLKEHHKGLEVKINIQKNKKRKR